MRVLTKLIEAAINIVEFNLREAMKFPTKGVNLQYPSLR